MPRRKKKGIPMPPLEFVHSPLYQNAPIVTYDFGHSNTATARTVDVDELDNFPWVSPQFKSKTTTQMCRTRQSTRLRSKSANSPITAFAEMKSRFPPLNFVETSPSFSVEKPKSKRKHFSPGLQDSDFHHQQSEVCRVDNNCTNTGGHNQKQDSPHIENFVVFQEVSPSIKTPNVHEKSTIQQISHRCDTLLPPGDYNTSSQARMDTSSITFDCNNEGRSSGFGTAGLEKTWLKFGRNFPRSNSFPPLVYNNAFQHSSSPIEAENDNPVFSRWNQCTPPCSSHVEVLVTDTPECDYGLSMRQKQLKYNKTDYRS